MPTESVAGDGHDEISTFLPGFTWGVAAASFQIEGGYSRRDRSVWDQFCETPNAVFKGHTGEIACDHYHRYPEDVAEIADMGAKAYRFSISWPRVISDDGTVREDGLDFYDRITDALLARDVEPWATLFHWDFPLTLFRRGGWLNRDSSDWFARYTEAVVSRLGDRVCNWMTLNEPQCFLGLGHSAGIHAPGLKLSRPDVLLAIHNALIAHGKAILVIRGLFPGKKTKVGWATHGSISYPVGHMTPEKMEAARQKTFSVDDNDHWFFSNSWYADPVVLGHYPEEGLSLFGQELPRNFEADLKQIKQPMDYFGVNIYQGQPITLDESHRAIEAPRPRGYPQTMCHWPVEPQVLYWGPKFFFDRYQLPIVITENGCASMDWVHQDGRVHDTPRIDYVARHLTALRDAIKDGTDVHGYFLWSILDNFEWAEGYRMRFGLIYVDYETLERIPKDSYMWYQQVIMSNGACLPEKPARLR